MSSEQFLYWMRYQLGGNSVSSYLTALATFVFVLGAAYLGRRVIVERLKSLAQRTSTDLDDLLVGLLASIRHPEFQLLAFFVATRGLALHQSVDKVLRIALVLALSVRAVLILQTVAGYAINKYAQSESDLTARSAVRNMQWLVGALLWVLALLFVLSNLGIDVTAFVTGLGIGGIAIALAAQAILGDLFSSFAIFMDKPFKVGEFIIVDGLMGTVEHVGVKTTRVRSLSGEMLIFPNSNLTGSRIRNFGPMERRRVVFSLGVTYQTPADKLRRIPALVRGIIEKRQPVTVDRVHFKGFGPSSLDFEAVYFVEKADYNVFMDQQQDINLDIVEAFAEEGIEFAYPTQTLFVEKLPSPAA